MAKRGYGCAVAGCHDSLNPAALPILRFDKEANLVYQDMIDPNLFDPNLGPVPIDIANPIESMLYTKPLREIVGLQNHPNFTCLSPESMPCSAILAWIGEGAPLAPPQ